MRASWITTACALGAVQVLNCYGAAHAQEAPEQELPAESRRVKNHVFLAPMLQEDAFVTTHVGIREGFATYEVPDMPVGSLGMRDITLNGFQQSIDLGLRITDWLGLCAFGRGLVITGTSSESLLLDGAQFTATVSGGVIVRLLKNESTGTQVALRARFTYEDGRDVTFQPFLRTVLETMTAREFAQVVEGSIGRLIIVPVEEKSVRGGAHVAQYITSFLSAQASVSYEHGWVLREPFFLDIDERSADEGDVDRVQLAAAAELDFSELFAPLSLLAEYRYVHGERTSETAPDTDVGGSSVGLGIYYVGRPNLQLGVGWVTIFDAEPRRGTGEDDQTELSGQPTVSYSDLILRYIW